MKEYASRTSGKPRVIHKSFRKVSVFSIYGEGLLFMEIKGDCHVSPQLQKGLAAQSVGQFTSYSQFCVCGDRPKKHSFQL